MSVYLIVLLANNFDSKRSESAVERGLYSVQHILFAVYAVCYNLLMSAVDTRIHGKICTMGQHRGLRDHADPAGRSLKQLVTDTIKAEEGCILKTKVLFEKLIVLETVQVLPISLWTIHEMRSHANLSTTDVIINIGFLVVLNYRNFIFSLGWNDEMRRIKELCGVSDKFEIYILGAVLDTQTALLLLTTLVIPLLIELAVATLR
jgi:hypothetical protein